MIEKAYKANRYKLYNGNIPNANKRPNDIDYIEKMYNEISFLMSSFGYPLENLSFAKKNNKLFKTSRRGIEALGNYFADKFDLLEGSQIDISKRCSLDKYNQMREELINSGDLQNINDVYILNKNSLFSVWTNAYNRNWYFKDFFQSF